jgi:hypothetical protein
MPDLILDWDEAVKDNRGTLSLPFTIERILDVRRMFGWKIPAELVAHLRGISDMSMTPPPIALNRVSDREY